MALVEEFAECYESPACSSGWTCPYCHQWVPNGVYHSCNCFPQYYTVDRSQEIVDLLREILDELKNK